jgi:hypothetical protein
MAPFGMDRPVTAGLIRSLDNTVVDGQITYRHGEATTALPDSRHARGADELSVRRRSLLLRPGTRARQRDLSFGSSSSRTASPNRLKPNTARLMAIPGKTAIQGALSAYSSAPPWSMSPQAGVGSCTPRPR